MTVSNLHMWQGRQEANCDWFEGTKHCTGSFPVTSLKVAEERHAAPSAAEHGLGGGPNAWMR